jgi:hypothetical protein
MKAYEFPAKVTEGGKIEFPDTILKYLAANQEVRVIVLVKETTDTEEENSAWDCLAAEQLFAGYSEEEAI